MANLIDKSALVAEIERIKKEECPTDTYEGRCKLFWFEQFLSFLDTLEVKEVQEPTASDRGIVEEIIINLKRVEQDYHTDLTREMEWLRNEVQKGE